MGRVSAPPVLSIRIEDLSKEPGLVGMCAGYERGEWRGEALIDDLINWLPEFALSESDLKSVPPAEIVRILRKALHQIYQTKKFTRRGELGELLLHAVLRTTRNSIPAISKIFYKDGPNETVKGFDAVHVVEAGDGLELWLGEVKFYTDVGAAIRDVVKELEQHTSTDYLRSEFVAITNKIDDRWKYASKLCRLLYPNVFLDEVFARACIPVLLTYDSETLAKHDSVCVDYEAAFEKEVRGHHETFAAKNLPKEVRIELFLVPLRNKSDLNTRFDEKLKAWQSI